MLHRILFGVMALAACSTSTLAQTPGAASATQMAPPSAGEDALEAAWKKYYANVQKAHDNILKSEQYRLFPNNAHWPIIP